MKLFAALVVVMLAGCGGGAVVGSSSPDVGYWPPPPTATIGSIDPGIAPDSTFAVEPGTKPEKSLSAIVAGWQSQ